MTHRNSIEHLSVAMTTETVDDVTQTTSTSVMTSSSSRGIEFEFYYRCAVIVIGIVGTAANAFILYAMVASKQHKKHILIFNQNAIDLFSCLFLAISYAAKLRKFDFTGLIGYWLCMLIFSDNILWCVIMASKANLVFVTIERYLKVVHSAWSKKKLHNWMIYLAVALAWISGFIHINALVFSTSAVIDGICYPVVIWKSQVAQLAYAIFLFLLFSVFILIIFVVCYWRILVVIRRQAQVMAAHGAAGPSTSQVQSHQMQSNVIKTMILVSAFYTVSDLPMNVFLLLTYIRGSVTILYGVYFSILFVSFFYFCANPFIYATKFEPVKRILLRLIPCKKTAVQPIESIHITPSTSRRNQIPK